MSRVVRPEIEAPIIPPVLDFNEIVAALLPLLGTERISLRKAFPSPAATWSWVHGLGVRPLVTVTVAGETVIPDIDYPDDNTMTVQFDSPVTGYLDIA